jgi:Na+-driven multidrug efflux pump
VFTYAKFQALMRGIGPTRLPLFIVLGTVILKFALDPIFIFGWGPLPSAGVVGAALATLITQALAAAVGMTTSEKTRSNRCSSWASMESAAAAFGAHVY